jgi:hypothetical protein
MDKKPNVQGSVTKMDIKSIKPYWRNPRDNAEAVEKVKKSIERFGYQQLIVVDNNGVIIAGHTRFKALIDLGYEEIDVVVADLSQEEAKKYRIIDNKTSEYAKWTDELTMELREAGDVEWMQNFFVQPISFDLNLSGLSDVTVEELIEKKKELDNAFNAPREITYDGVTQLVACPECAHEFHVQLNARINGVKIKR